MFQFFKQIREFYRENKKEKATVYYKHLLFGGKSLLLRSYIILATLPFYSKLYLDAFLRTIYRLFISHNNLLNWVTAEEAAKRVDKNFAFYLKHYTFHFFTTFAIYFNINIRELEKLVHQHPLTVIYYYVKNSCVLTLIALKIGI